MFRILLNESLSSDAFEGGALQESLSRATASHIHAINKVNLAKPERNLSDWSNLDRASRSDGVRISATVSPLHLCVGGVEMFCTGFTVMLCGQQCRPCPRVWCWYGFILQDFGIKFKSFFVIFCRETSSIDF